MAVELEELFVVEVGVGIATLDASTDEGVVTDKVVVEQVTATDRKTDETRELMLVYGAREVIAVADRLKEAAERALSEED
jgi:hypothetical protein